MKNDSNYRWVVLALSALTMMLTMAVPLMSLSVLLPEISAELGLSVVQVGLVWGIGSIPAIITGLLGGPIGDRFGARRTILVTSLLVGVTGALRGLAVDFFTLAATMVLFSLLAPIIPMNITKLNGQWFSHRQLGLANGVTSMGMALGFMIGSLIAAAWLSPWLGGWRNVMFLYGALAVAIGLPWAFIRHAPGEVSTATGTQRTPIWKSIGHVARLRNEQLLGFALLGIGGCIQGMLGYLPLYLDGIGWSDAAAGSTLASFHGMSLLCVIPIALWSDRIGLRKPVMIACTFLFVIGTGLLSVVDGGLIWLAVILAGLSRDGFMAVFMTAVIEVKGVGVHYASTAVGLILMYSSVGNLIAPPIGNSLASISPGAPFLFWALMAAAGLVVLFWFREGEKEIAVQPSM
jgi:MFS family permease